MTTAKRQTREQANRLTTERSLQTKIDQTMVYLDGIDEVVHHVLIMVRRGSQSQPLLSKLDGGIVDGLDVDVPSMS